MGNRICKKKNNESLHHQKSPSRINRIVKSLYMVPHSWKSESQLNKRENANSDTINTKASKIQDSKKPFRSSDWTEAFLEVPSDSEKVKNKPTLSFTFILNNTPGPKPPPRKKKKELKNVPKNNLINNYENMIPVAEPICIKKTINYHCPCHLSNHANCKRIPSLESHKEVINDKVNEETKRKKRQKNLSVVSLPNFNDFKMQLFEDKEDDTIKNQTIRSSSNSLSLGNSKKNQIKSYMTRCRSFGSLLPNQLLGKMKPSVKNISDVESDDSFGGLEDWDLKLIEHYNPRDASLPRPSKSKKNSQKLSSNTEFLETKSLDINHELPEQNMNHDECHKMSIQSADNSMDSDHSSLLQILEKYSTESKTSTDNNCDKMAKPLLKKNSNFNNLILTENNFLKFEKLNNENNFEFSATKDKEEILV